MKKIIFILLLLGLTSCNNSTEKYTLEVTYFNGDRDTLVYNLGNTPRLREGDMWAQGYGTFLSGVRSFKVLKQERYDK